VSKEAFEFVRELASELARNAIELPSFPAVAVRIQKVLSDQNVATERIVHVLGAEPMMATRVLSMTNSAALAPIGKPVTELRAAVTRLGLDALRSAVIGYAVAQLRRAASFKGIEPQLNALWQHSLLVATLSLVIARRSAKVSADTAMLTGLVHSVGKLYILTHSMQHPVLFADQTMYQSIVRDWHANIAKALLESWRMPQEIVDAVHSYEDEARNLHGPSSTLTDVLELAELLSLCKHTPDLMHERLKERKAALRLGIDLEVSKALVEESAEELAALRAALGN
jgi:HD-like signal output (HDOD) protein